MSGWAESVPFGVPEDIEFEDTDFGHLMGKHEALMAMFDREWSRRGGTPDLLTARGRMMFRLLGQAARAIKGGPDWETLVRDALRLAQKTGSIGNLFHDE